MAKVNDLFKNLNGKTTDPRTRRYLVPQRVVYTQGYVDGADNLLRETPDQITFNPQTRCYLQNKQGEPHAGVLLDFGTEFAGALRIYVHGVRNDMTPDNPNNVKLHIRLGESVMEALTPIGVKNTTNNHATRDFELLVNGLSANETPESGYRFAYIELADDAAAANIVAAKGVFCYRDLNYIGSFESSDELLNQIWNVAAYTVHLNMQEHLWDGIKRDRLVWIGDMHTEVQTILAVFGTEGLDVIKKSLDLIRDDTPVDQWMNHITTYSLWWLFIHHDLYRQVGDLAYLEEQKEYMTQLVKNILPLVDEEGSEQLPGRRFLDWPNDADDVAKHAGLHAMLKMTLDRCVDLMNVLGEPRVAMACKEKSALMTRHQPEMNASKQAACLMTLAGLMDAKEINDKYLEPGQAHGYSTFFSYYLLSAKAMAGDFTGALRDIRTYYGAMLDMGATTFWEDFNLDWIENSAPIDEIVPEGKNDIHGDFGAYCYTLFRHSLCHGWSSGPCPYMMHYVLGIKALDADTYEIDPELADLDWAKGTYPTPKGLITVSAERTPDGVKVEVSAPQGIRIVRKS